MKKHLLISALSFLNIHIYSQSLTLTEIKTYMYSGTSSVNNMLLSKGWDVDFIKKGDGTQYMVTRWSHKNKTGNTIDYFEYQAVPDNQPECVICNHDFDVLFISKEKFISYKKQLASDPKYKHLPEKILEGEIIEYYSDDKDRITFKLKTTKSKDITFYSIECHKTNSVIIMKELFSK